MSGNFQLWSQTASSNDVADSSVSWAEGMAPGQVNNSSRAMMAAIASWRDDNNGTITTGGTANSLTFTSAQTLATYLNGITIKAKAGATNTTAATLNLNTLGAKSIRCFDTGAEAAIAAGQIITGMTYEFRYDTAANSAAGAWILLNPTPDPATVVGVGDIKIWSNDTLPTGFLWCNGVSYLQSDYPALYAKIVGTYGGDATHFNVPDLRGRAPFGSDDMGTTAASRITNSGSSIVGTTLGASGGAENTTLIASNIPSHTHSGTTNSDGVDHTHTGTTGTESVTHTHSVAPGTPSTTNGTFTGPGSTGWGGSVTTATTGTQSANHTHSFTSSGASAFNHTHAFTTGATGNGFGFGTMPPALITNFIIKT